MEIRLSEIETIVFDSLKDIIDVYDIKIENPINKETRLFGSHGILKSIELVSLIVDLEEKIAEKYAIPLILADERAMSQNRSPFRTISSLAQYIYKLLEEESNRKILS
jgi:acyl carrier protein